MLWQQDGDGIWYAVQENSTPEESEWVLSALKTEKAWRWLVAVRGESVAIGTIDSLEEAKEQAVKAAISYYLARLKELGHG